jgi:hypothetical protein
MSWQEPSRWPTPEFTNDFRNITVGLSVFEFPITHNWRWRLGTA